MPKKLNGEQLPLLMPVLDRPRDEWIDMHCPLLSGCHLGDRVENEQHLQGTVTRHPDAAALRFYHLGSGRDPIPVAIARAPATANGQSRRSPPP